MRNVPKIGLVIPCFNEEDVLRETSDRLIELLNQMIDKSLIKTDSFIYYVDDGSKDKTWSIIEELNSNTPLVKGLKLSRNFGHQNALLAGLLSLRSIVDCTISLDADLQDDLSVIPMFIDHFINGAEIVYGVRNQRNKDSFLKKSTALGFYKLMHLMGTEVISNHADYRLCSSKVLDHLAEFGEVNLFLRGILPLIGFKSNYVYYERKERFAGETKYPLKKMLSFSLDGITSFSTAPLRFITAIGFLLFIVCLVIMGYYLAAYFSGSVVPGWTSTVLPIYFIGGVQLFCMGLIGEYIGRIYKEVKQRPRYIKEKDLL